MSVSSACACLKWMVKRASQFLGALSRKLGPQSFVPLCAPVNTGTNKLHCTTIPPFSITGSYTTQVTETIIWGCDLRLSRLPVGKDVLIEVRSRVASALSGGKSSCIVSPQMTSKTYSTYGTNRSIAYSTVREAYVGDLCAKTQTKCACILALVSCRGISQWYFPTFVAGFGLAKGGLKGPTWCAACSGSYAALTSIQVNV
eukprot:6381387-Amphidinium_carterae.1